MGMGDCGHEYRFNLHRVSCLVKNKLSAPNEIHQAHQIEEPHLSTPPTRYLPMHLWRAFRRPVHLRPRYRDTTCRYL